MKNEQVDWDDPALTRWMGTITRSSTKNVYMSSFRLYASFTGMTATQLVDEALDDQRKDPREKRDIVTKRLIDFYNWLVEEAPKRKGPRGEEVSKGIASKTAHTYVNSVRSFYATFDVYVKLKGRSRLPRARVENRRMILSNVDVKRLVNHAVSPRDRAMILTMFQGGMDVSTLCGLKYGDVADGLEDHPLKLKLQREKTGTEFYTFLGRDAVEALKAYLNDARAKGLKFNNNTPLLLKESHKALKGESVTTNLAQDMLRKLAVKAGFVDEEMNGMHFNPLGPHALRESFGSIMSNKGVPDSIVDFWLGHEIGEMAEAYKRTQFEDLKRIYLEKEVFLSVSTGGELEETLRAELDEKSGQLQTLVNGLATENMELKDRMKGLEKSFDQRSRFFDRLFRYLIPPEELAKMERDEQPG